MDGIVESDQILPLAQDEKMLQYFNESRIWVYENDLQLSGFTGLKGDFISWLFVHPDFRRRGIARKLLLKLIGENNNCLMLSIVKSNHAAMSLYLDLGFRVFEEFEGRMYGYKIPAVRMKRNKGA
ncbi:MAG: GNAT family N-acetyltransferase [Cytophagales bacterium]|nr:GNAT family N-acetyltransferase [Cytophagales bacterium]